MRRNWRSWSWPSCQFFVDKVQDIHDNVYCTTAARTRAVVSARDCPHSSVPVCNAIQVITLSGLSRSLLKPCSDVLFPFIARPANVFPSCYKIATEEGRTGHFITYKLTTSLERASGLWSSMETAVDMPASNLLSSVNFSQFHCAYRQRQSAEIALQ